MHHRWITWTTLILIWGIMLFFVGRTVVTNVRKLHKEGLTVKDRKDLRRENWRVLGVLVFSCASVGFLWCILWYSKHSREVLEVIVRSLGARARLAASLAALVIGIGAYWFKKVDTYRYGLIEIAFGSIAGGIATSYIGVANFYATVATFIGCVYVVSRGCDHVMKGHPKELAKQKEKQQQDLLDSFTI